MIISNDQHIVLHKEAQDVINQASRDSWQYCFVELDKNSKWPRITLANYNGYQLHVDTVPGYVTQNLLGREPKIEVRYNRPLLTINQIKQLYQLLGG